MIDDQQRQSAFRAAMALAAAGQWRSCSLEDIAAEAGVDPHGLTRAFGTKTRLLKAFAESIDAEVAAGLDADISDASIPVRERLLEVLMMRLDALAPYKDGIAKLLHALPGDPASAMNGALALDGSMRAALKAVGVGAAGPCGAIRAKGLIAVFLVGVRSWLEDDSPDLSTTQRVLDERLKQAEVVARMVGLARDPKTG